MTNVGAKQADMLDGVKRLFGLSRPALPAQQDWLVSPPRPERSLESPVITAARNLPHGAVCGDDLRRAIDVEVRNRRAAANMLDGPASPTLSGELTVRSDGLPSWWRDNGNLLICPADLPEIKLELAMTPIPPRGALVVAGRDARPGTLQFHGERALAVFGDRIVLSVSSVSVAHGAVLIGAGTTATFMARLDCRNGGVIIAGADCMWAAGVNLLTDDCHTIRDLATGKRVNRYGGRIMIEDHVWLGEQVRLMGDCRIGRDSIVGMGSFVKNAVLPTNTISVGRPARPVRFGVTWTREDIP